jgi:hypothetical protein
MLHYHSQNAAIFFVRSQNALLRSKLIRLDNIQLT